MIDNHIAKLRNKYYRFKISLTKFKLNKNRYNQVLYLTERLPFSGALVDIDNISTSNSDVFQIINPEKMERPFVKIINNGVEQTIGIRCWKVNEYKLSNRNKTTKRPLFTDTNICIYWENEFLYKQTCDGIVKLCAYQLDDFMYSDMEYAEGWYAIRSGGIIRISSDLQNWKEVYRGKRGIKNSMCFCGSGKNLSLLFIEYTPGVVRERHKVWKYSVLAEDLSIIKEFYTEKEHITQGLFPCARHIHVIMKDPFTGDLYVGTGDSDIESGIYCSKDNGKTFELLFGGKQDYRALSFIFTKNAVFWNTDTHESQAIYRILRKDMAQKKVTRFPLVNGALWCSLKYPVKINGCDFYIMSSNSEGALFDNYNRVYGIKIDNDVPVFYELIKKRSRTCYSQLFILGLDINNRIYFYDHEIGVTYSYSLC